MDNDSIITRGNRRSFHTLNKFQRIMVYCGFGPEESAHPLDNCEPSQVLSKCFQTIGCLSRFMGNLPMSINKDGFASAKLLSVQTFMFLIYIGTFVTTSAIYLPVYLKLTFSRLQGDTVAFVSENLFVGGQLLGVILTILLIPIITSRLVKFWNKLVPLITSLIILQGHSIPFRQVYRRSRISLAAYLVSMQVYSIICWSAFAAGNELEKVKFDSSIKYWIHGIGFVVFFSMCFCHVVHAFLLMFFSFTLRLCFSIVQDLVVVGTEEPVTEDKGQRVSELRGLLALYEELAEVTQDVGNTFGFYLLLELVVMMTSILMNVFTMVSGFKQRDPLSTCLCFVAYITWMIGISESGQRLHNQAKKCAKSLKEAVYSNCQSDMLLIHKVNALAVPKMTAGNYFTLNRKLAVKMGSTFATYVVVIIQFKMNAFNNK